MNEKCGRCHLIHPPMTPCEEARMDAMADLLLKIGSVDKCDCGETIFWITRLDGRKRPYTRAGLNHFKDCTGKFAERRGKP